MRISAERIKELREPMKYLNPGELYKILDDLEDAREREALVQRLYTQVDRLEKLASGRRELLKKASLVIGTIQVGRMPKDWTGHQVLKEIDAAAYDGEMV
jgi:hypothetical protein